MGVLFINSSNNVTRKMRVNFHNDRYAVENNAVGFVEIFNIFTPQHAFILGMDSFNRI